MSPTLPIIKYFAYKHLPPHLQAVSEPFALLANVILERYVNEDVDEEETLAGLRKLLEAKDCIVRSLIK